VTKFARFATRVWGIPQEGQTAEELAKAGVEALADFIREIGLPTTLRELGMTDESVLPDIANSCAIVAGSYRKLSHEEILEIFKECW
jgi:alcohol dehydrogenase YqhD (iron-dependent ADH family)